MKTPSPGDFRSRRQFAAWTGLTPQDHSTAGKVRLGVITRAGDEALRSVLVVGAAALLRFVASGSRKSAFPPWLEQPLKRKPTMLVAVALANKMVHIAWKMMLTGESYNAKSVPATLVAAM
jgi:transposase